MGRRRQVALLVAGSLGLHAALVLLAPRRAPEPIALRPARARPVPLAVRRERIELARLELVRPAAAAALPPAPRPRPRPRPALAPPPPVAPPPAVPPPPAAPAPRPAAPPAPAPPAPAPLIVSNVALGGGVQVETGTTSNLYGDPRADRRGWRAPPPAPPAGEARAPAARRVVVKPPVIRADARGSYPPQHRDLGRVVRVELLLDIDATGAVTRVHVARGELPAFDAEARATGARLRFHPATRDGVAIAYQLRWTIVFIPEGT